MEADEREIPSSFLDERNSTGIVPLDVPTTIELDVYPNQRDLAMELLARLEFLLQKQGKTWDDFDIFDFQVRFVILNKENCTKRKDTFRSTQQTKSCFASRAFTEC